jgi:hypothetical protein
MKTEIISIAEIKKEITKQVADEATLQTLLATTFKGLSKESVKPAILEGMLRGFTFTDFLEKNIYAIPYGSKYSLVTSIDWARKIGMRSGVVGKSAPVFVEDEKGNIVSCTVTIKRMIDGHVGEYTETVFFKEYSTGKNLWVSKPRTMISKVAEMHALRMACPEELSQAYVEEERESEMIKETVIDVTDYEGKLRSAKNLDDVKAIWASLPIQAKQKLETVKSELKKKYENA